MMIRVGQYTDMLNGLGQMRLQYIDIEHRSDRQNMFLFVEFMDGGEELD